MSNDAEHKTWLERALGIITEVKPGESGTALLMTLNVFFLLTAYYVIKPVREALILNLPGGPEYKAYLGGAIALTLIFAVPAYSRFADRLSRNRLVVGVTLFFMSNLGVFYLLSFVDALKGFIAAAFYVWVGLFNMMIVAQFWAFANDIYSEAQGKRLFPLLGGGQSLGAAVGSLLLIGLVEGLGILPMLLVAGAILGLSAWLFHAVHLRELKHPSSEHPDEQEVPASESDKSKKPKVSRRDGFSIVAQHRYLKLLAAFSLVFTFVNTNGEYMLGVLVKEAANEAVAGGAISAEEKRQFIGSTYASFFLFVNVASVAIQLFLVSRIVRYGGLKLAFPILPLIALGDAIAVALYPVLSVIRIGKIAENSVDYSINNTVRNMLWLPTTREMKYKAKQAVDTFFVRMGDVSSALLVYAGAQLLGWGVRAFAVTNICLVAIWLWLVVAILRDNRRMVERKARAETSPAPVGAE